MQTRNPFIDDLTKMANGAMGALTGVKDEVEARIRDQIAKILDGMDIPRRDEFDAVKAMAAKAREENEELKKQIAELQAEARSSAGPRQSLRADARRRRGRRHLHRPGGGRRRQGGRHQGAEHARVPDIGAFAALTASGIDLARIEDLGHGSTVATNAVLERKGASVAFIATAGFRDLLFMQRHDRRNIYDLFYAKPAPPVRRKDCFEATERLARRRLGRHAARRSQRQRTR